MAGTWESNYESNGEKIEQWVIMTWTMNHNFFEIKTIRKYNENNNKINDELGLFTINNENNLVGWGFDNSGFNGMWSFNGLIEESKVILNGTNVNSECRIIFELNDKQLKHAKEIKNKDGQVTSTEVIYSNIKSDIKISSLTPKYDKITSPGLAYVCHISEHIVTVFDTKTNELLGNIPCGNGPD